MAPRIDLLALSAAVIALLMSALYLFLISQEDGDPAMWAIVMLVGSSLGAAYATARRSPWRRSVLGVCAAALGALGYLAIFSIGLPLLLAGSLCLAAVLRSRPAKDWRDSV